MYAQSVAMSSKHILKVDWATHKATKYACKHWHYSKSIPGSKLVKIGVWENDIFIGVVIYSNGANNNIGRPYNLETTECVELTRVALNKHITPVSRILSLSQKFLKKFCPKIKLIVSYADIDMGHHGCIYQANGWIYAGISGKNTKSAYIIKGKKIHPKTIFERYGTRSECIVRKKHPDLKMFVTKGKHIYLMPLDEQMRKQVSSLSKPYPKRALSKDSVASEYHSEKGGVIPTNALQTNNQEIEQ